MRKFISSIAFLWSICSVAQIHNPVTWKTSVKQINNEEYILIAEANIQSGWHLYSQNIKDGGPIPTTFTFHGNTNYTLKGNTKEPKGHTMRDKVFDNMEIIYFEGKPAFEQKIILKNKKKVTINATVEYMVCNDTNCLPPTEEDLVFIINPAIKKKSEFFTKNVEDTRKDISKKNWLSIFLIAFFSGFAALLTPCVFPMIPMTVSFFIKQSKNKVQGIRNAIFYGISIIVIYVLLGSAITAIFGADALNALSTNVWFNIIFFLILIIFAVSFLGAFEITLPSSWGTKIDSQADRDGLIGIFFMALALAIVSFSCTGPIVGTLLVEAASKGGMAPVIGMFGFSAAIALPFALFAAFPGWLNSLPKSGGWLNTVKVVLGFLELALAFKFLSNADLVIQTHLLEREVFIAIWIAIFGTLSLYLLGKIQLPHDSPLQYISVSRLSLGIITLGFTLYMVPGLWGAPLNLISAFPPPQHYSESPYGVGFSRAISTINYNENKHREIPDGAHLIKPHDILAFKDYNKGLTYAKKIGKPIMIDFTGWACVNCRKMEQNVWVNPKILNILKNKVVLISLYVDDRQPLKEKIDSKIRPGKKLKYIGQKWSELQVTKYKANSQPFYVLINHNQVTLTRPIGYTPDVDTYYNWLKEGIEKFEQ